MKPFNLEMALAKHPISTAGGYPARLLDSEFKSAAGRLVVAVERTPGEEVLIACHANGSFLYEYKNYEHEYDLRMAPTMEYKFAFLYDGEAQVTKWYYTDAEEMKIKTKCEGEPVRLEFTKRERVI